VERLRRNWGVLALALWWPVASLSCSSPSASPTTAEPTQPDLPPEAVEGGTARYQFFVSPPVAALAELDAMNESLLTEHVGGSSHLLMVRITEAGSLQETMPDGERRSYDYAWVEVRTTLYATSEGFEAYRARFPIFHLTGFETPSGDRGEGVPSPISNLRGRTGQEVIFVGDLPSPRGSSEGWVPEPLREGGYERYVVQTRELLGPHYAQRVMAVVGPQ